MMDSTYHIKMAAFRELQEAVETKKVCDELVEYLASSLRYILWYSKKYNIPIPEDKKITDMIHKLIETERKIPAFKNKRG